MKLRIITVGQPKLEYAKQGWEEYYKRLAHYHQVRTSHLSDKHNDAAHILGAIKGSYSIALVKEGKQFTSEELAEFLEQRAIANQEVSLIIGGPDGLPQTVLDAANLQWSFGKLTFPHDLAMVILLEAMYRASTISASQPYHK